MYSSKEIIEKFWTYIDEDYTGYWNDDQIQRFADNALWNMVEMKSRQAGFTDKIDDELMPITREVSGTLASGRINLDGINYRKLDWLTADYGKGERRVTPMTSTERGDMYSDGTHKYPKYSKYSNAGVRYLLLEPTTRIGGGNPTYSLKLYVEPSFNDLTRIVANSSNVNYQTPLKWTAKFTELIIDEMVKLAAQTIQEAGYSNAAQANEQMNP
jgi:hypothetical protein